MMRALVAGLLGLLVLAQAPAPETPHARPTPAIAETQRLPPAATSHQSLDLTGRTLHFTAIAGSQMLTDAQGAPQAEIATLSYLLDGADAARPVTFVFNGGPGAASAWLQLGGLGPWRVAMDHPVPSAAPTLLPNDDTWLDATDLVFIDPVGTGFSHFLATGDEARKRLWSVDGDIAALAEVIQRWLVAHHRLDAPKFLAGESYGGFRGPRLVRELAEHQGIGVRGMVLVSPVLDFGGHSAAFDPLRFATTLPSLTAAARASAGPVTRAQLADVEAYAAGPYLTALIAGETDAASLAAMEARVAAFTGLNATLVAHRRGRISAEIFLNEQHADAARLGSPYDATTTQPDPFPAAVDMSTPDPVTDALAPAVTSAMLALYTRLEWLPPGPYHLLEGSIARQWDYHWGRFAPQSMRALREALALDPALHVLVVHGLYDLVTPYFATVLQLNQIAAGAGADRVRLLTLPGGHMVYRDDAARAALHAAALEMMR